MRLLQIFTENKSNLPDIVSKYFKGFTILRGYGYWDGVKEECAVIMIVTDHYSGDRVAKLIKEIKRENKQEAVLFYQNNGYEEVV